MSWWIIICIYIVVLIILIALLAQTKRHKRRFEVIFTYDLDFVFYEMAKNIEAGKDSLYDYQNTLEILYHDKKAIFTKPIKSYQEQFPKIQENVAYLEKLLQKEIFAADFRKRLNQNYQALQRVSKVSAFVHTILTFWTLGIAKIWAI